jgi:hypothetical protein
MPDAEDPSAPLEIGVRVEALPLADQLIAGGTIRRESGVSFSFVGPGSRRGGQRCSFLTLDWTGLVGETFVRRLSDVCPTFVRRSPATTLNPTPPPDLPPGRRRPDASATSVTGHTGRVGPEIVDAVYRRGAPGGAHSSRKPASRAASRAPRDRRATGRPPQFPPGVPMSSTEV